MVSHDSDSEEEEEEEEEARVCEIVCEMED